MFSSETIIWLVVAAATAIIVAWTIDLFRNRKPLNSEEVRRLAIKRRRNRSLFELRYSSRQLPADPAEKKAMKGTGEFISCELDWRDTPSRIASLLKYKKHEWIVLTLVIQNITVKMWWNKGPDGTRVWSLLDDEMLEQVIRRAKPDVVAIFHNHPNPDPARYLMTSPSEADLRSANRYGHWLGEMGISLLEFICERGSPHMYFASFSDSVVPLDPIVSEVESANGRSIWKNYSLQKELKAHTTGDRIPGLSITKPDVAA